MLLDSAHLPVRKNGAVEAFHDLLHDGHNCLLVQLLLVGIAAKDL